MIADPLSQLAQAPMVTPDPFGGRRKLRRAVVTGPTGGIGRAVVVELRRHLDDVVELERTRGWDVTHRDLLAAAFIKNFGLHSPIDVVVCCHAAPADADFETVLAVDLTGAHNVMRAALPCMADGGHIILFSSIRAHAPRATQAAYAAAKAGVEGLTRALAVQLGPRGITVNAIAPGAVRTPRTEANIAAGVVSERELIARTPTRALTTPEQVAGLVSFLASPAAAGITGQVLTMDGGWSVSG